MLHEPANSLPPIGAAGTPDRRAVVGRAAARRTARLAVGALTVLVAATAIGLATAPLLGQIVDLVVDERAAERAHRAVVLLVLVAAIAQGC